jgi:hypothetical protein
VFLYRRDVASEWEDLGDVAAVLRRVVSVRDDLGASERISVNEIHSSRARLLEAHRDSQIILRF